MLTTAPVSCWDASPSKHAGSNSHLVRIGWEVLARSRPDDFCTPACFQTRSMWPKPDSQPELNWISAGFAQYYPGCLWKNGTAFESWKLVAGQLHPARNWARWFLHTSLLPDQMHLAKPRPGHPDGTWVSFAQCDLCLLWKNGAETKQMWEVWSGIIILSSPNLAAPWP